jgi:hypothetical protein
MTDKAYAVPLHELLASVPREARLVIDDDDGMGTRFIPVGRYCNEAAEALRARLTQPEQPQIVWIDNKQTGNFLNIAPPQREWQVLTEDDVAQAWAKSKGDVLYRLKPFAQAIEAKLKAKNAL